MITTNDRVSKPHDSCYCCPREEEEEEEEVRRVLRLTFERLIKGSLPCRSTVHLSNLSNTSLSEEFTCR